MTGVTNILVGPGSPDTLHPDAGKKLHDLCYCNPFFTGMD